MLIAAFAFAVIFLLRDVQILAVPPRKTLPVRFGSYAVLLLTAMVIFATLTNGRPAWTGSRFALGAIAVQLAELTINLGLQRYSPGRYGWIGCILPSPVFLMALYAFALEIQNRVLNVDVFRAAGIVTVVWLLLVGGLASVFYWLDDPSEDRKFAIDFAIMTTCTAIVFVPFWLS